MNQLKAAVLVLSLYFAFFCACQCAENEQSRFYRVIIAIGRLCGCVREKSPKKPSKSNSIQDTEKFLEYFEETITEDDNRPKHRATHSSENGSVRKFNLYDKMNESD